MATGIEEPRIEPAAWPHQVRAVEQIQQAIAAGHKKILLASPTGSGKTRIMLDLIREWLTEGLKVALYTNRKMLIEQTSRVMHEAGITHGVRAAGWDSSLGCDVQISSIQTEASRVVRTKQWALHEADRVLVDEAHLQKSSQAIKLFGLHEMDGAVRVGVTATPLNLKDMYDILLVGSTMTELRACGALVKAIHYGPDEPDLKNIGRVEIGDDLSERQQRQAIMRPGIFARVLESFSKLNPDRKPTLLFAPDVAGSLWFAEQFAAAGIPAAHIDGAECWKNGHLYKTSRSIRQDILGESRDGKIVVLCNRYVLREGIDCPWLIHAILACVFGALQSFLQSGGRMLRACPGKLFATIQDHGGNWWRHGSLNADRHWELFYTANMVAAMRLDHLRENIEPEPFCCPRCRMIRVWHGPRCPGCGLELFDPNKKSRPVIQSDGTLREMKGPIVKPRRVCLYPDTQQKWTQVFYRCRHSGRTFRQAEGLFVHENGYWPPRTLKNMPLIETDWFMKIDRISTKRLRIS